MDNHKSIDLASSVKASNFSSLKWNSTFMSRSKQVPNIMTVQVEPHLSICYANRFSEAVSSDQSLNLIIEKLLIVKILTLSLLNYLVTSSKVSYKWNEDWHLNIKTSN